MKTHHPKSMTLRALAATLGLALAAFTLAAPAESQVKHPDDIVYPPLPEVDVPQPERVELANGMVVMVIENHELPLVQVRAVIRTGGRWEPADQVGLARLTGGVMRSGGTRSMASDDLDDLLEDKAAIIETSIGDSSGSAFMSCLAEDFAEMLKVFAEVLRHPAFEEDKLAVAKTQLVAGIARQNDSPNQILSREFTELIYDSDSPYARSPTYATVDNVGRDDLVAWHAKHYHPDRVILGLTGDFETATAVALVEEIFGSWPRGGEVAEPEVPYRQEPRPGVFYVEKNDVTQSNIRLGHLGIRRDHPDFYAVEMMNQVLSGSFAARLFSRVRSQKGLAYNVFGRVTSRWDYPGIFLMSMSTKTETTAAGIEALLKEAHNMTAEPPTDEEVEKARAAFLNSFVFRADSTSEILGQQMTYEYYGYPLDWLERYRQGIEKVTTAEVRAAAANHIHPDRFTILVVGPREGTDKPLSTFGEVTEVDVTIPEPAAPAVAVTAEGEKRGAELIARAVDGLGGAERLASLRSLAIESTIEMSGPQGAMEVKSRGLMVLPDRIRVEMTLPFGTMVQVLAGDSGFVQSPQGTQPLPESQVEQLKANLLRRPVVLLSRRGTPGFRAVAQGPGEVGGRSVERVYVEVDGQAQTLGIDIETGDILSLEFRGQGMAGAPGDMRQVNSDFREVDGLKLPFFSEMTFNGEPMVKAAVDAVVVNPEVDDSAFTAEQ